MIPVKYYSIMTRTSFSNDIDIAPAHFHELTGHTIPSNSVDHYVPSRVQLGRHWTEVKRGQKAPTGWQVVSYRRPRRLLTEEQERRRYMRKAEQQSEMDEIMADPERHYKYERNLDINGQVQRLQRNPRFYGWSKKQLWRYVDGYMGRAAEPTVLRNPNLDKNEQMSPEEHRPAGSRRAAAIERRAEEGILEHKEFSPKFIEQIKDTRSRRTVKTEDGVERPMTQEDLAMLVNVNGNVIRDFEAGKLIFDGALKSKLIWKLGLGIQFITES